MCEPMHIDVNKTGNISNIHLENWDRSAMPPELERKIHLFLGKQESEFLVFSFIEKLFLYTKMFYSSREDKPSLWLWSNSILAPEGDDKVIAGMIRGVLGTLKQHYAVFTYKSEEILPNSKMLAFEDFTQKILISAGFVSEFIEIPEKNILPKQMFILFGLFNITRNGRNDVNYTDSVSGEFLKSVASNHGYIVAIDKVGKLCALSAVDVVIAPKDELKQFIRFHATEPRDEKQAKAIGVAMRFLSGIEREIRLERTKLPENIDREALDLAYRKCTEDIARLDDLPVFLKNLIANMYYESAIHALNKDQKDHSKKGIESFFSNISSMITNVKYAPEYVRILRSTKDGKEYQKIAKDIFYKLKYGVFASKISLFKRIFLRYKKPNIDEISDLYLYF